jgi:hypothetical protein
MGSGIDWRCKPAVEPVVLSHRRQSIGERQLRPTRAPASSQQRSLPARDTSSSIHTSRQKVGDAGHRRRMADFAAPIANGLFLNEFLSGAPSQVMWLDEVPGAGAV